MLLNDIRYAMRLMQRSPGFTAVAVLSLALGIGANTAIFSLINTIMLRMMSVERPEELVQLLQEYPGEPRGGYWSARSFEHIRTRARAFSDLASTAFDQQTRVTIDGSEIEPVICESISANYFSFLGLRPAIGRLIGPDDHDDAGIVVLSWPFWNSRFGLDPNVAGRSIIVQGVPRTVIGVAPRGYEGPLVGLRTDLWVPALETGGAVLARLKNGSTIDQARAEMQVLYRHTIEERAATSKDPLVRKMKVSVEPAGAGFARIRDQYGKPLVLLMAAVGALLLLACINLATLLLARGAGRQREMSVRVGLGATRGRLLRQSLTESLLLSGAGTVVGCAVAWLGTGALVRILASARLHERIALEVRTDARVLAFAAGLAILTGLLFGIAPAWHAMAATPAAGLRHFGKAGETRGWRLFGQSLVALQVGISILLVTGAFVLVSHQSRLRSDDLGFRTDDVLLVQLDPARSGYSREQLARRYAEMLTRMRAIPGVLSVSITGCTPIQGCGASRFVIAEGHAERAEERRFTALSWVAPDYFQALGIPLLAGRDFQLADAARPRVAVISQSMARHHFGDRNPIGKRIAIDRDPRTGGWYGSDEPYEVVGVVADIKYTEIHDPPRRTMYLNMFQEDRVSHQFVLRTSVPPGSVAGDARRIVSQVLNKVSVSWVTTLAEQIDSALVPERLMATLSGLFGALGAVLAGIGLYGLLAYRVARQVNEIGVRMVLGATRADIGRMVLADAAGMVMVGILLGAPLVVWGGALAQRLIVDLEFPNAGWIVCAAAVLGSVVGIGSGIPARRAARVDPADALRQE